MRTVTSGRPTVLMLTKSLWVGGIANLIVDGSQHWDRDRFDYRVAYMLPGADVLVERLAAAGVPVDYVGSEGRVGPGVLTRFRRLLREHRPDVIHAHQPVPAIVARVATRVPTVYSEYAEVGLYVTPTRLVNRLTYWRNRAVIACTKGVARSIARYPGPEPVVIPNGVDARVGAEQVVAARAELGVRPDQPLVVHLAMVRPEKGHRTLLAAAPLLRERVPDAQIVSIGGERTPGLLARLREEAAAQGGDVRLLGFVDEHLPYVGAADVFVNPSDTEGLPVAVLEAMMLGRPVVATGVGGVPDAIEHGRSGLLVPPRDPPGLAAAIAEVLRDRGLGARLGEEGRRVAERGYGLERMVRETEEIYRQVLGNGTR